MEIIAFTETSVRNYHYLLRNDQEGRSSYQLLFCADDVNILGRSVYTVKKNTETLVVANKEIGLEVNAGKTKYKVMSRDGNKTIKTKLHA